MTPAYLTAREPADAAALQAVVARERRKTRTAFVRCAVGVAATKASTELVLTGDPTWAIVGFLVSAAFWWWVNVSIHRELMEDRP